MALIPGTNIIAPVVPFDTADVYPSHYSHYGHGGLHSVATGTDRNNISEFRRAFGMLVYVEADEVIYILRNTAPLTGPTSNSDWDTFAQFGTQQTRLDEFNPGFLGDVGPFTLNNGYVSDSELVFVNGIALSTSEYTIALGQLTLNASDYSWIDTNTVIKIQYRSPATLIPNEIIDSDFEIKDNVDTTKIAKFEASAITTGTTRTYTFPDNDGTIALVDDIISKSTFEFTQAVPSITWSITHNLAFYPNVTVVDSGNNVVIGEVDYIDNNSLTITFSASFSGKAYLS